MSADRVAALAAVPWLGLGIATVVAAALALGANQGLKWALAVPEGARTGPLVADVGAVDGDDDDVAPTTPPLAVALSESAYREAILGRHLFDQNQIGKDEEEGEGEGSQQELTFSGKLRGTVVAVPEAYSAAFIQVDGATTAYAYGIGQKILDAEVKEILVDRVRLERQGSDVWLEMAKESETPRDRPTTDAATSGDVEKKSDTEFVIERSMIDEQLADLAGLGRMARALLHRGSDGEYDGYRLSAIRRGSLPDKLGIRNGDIVHNVNGLELNSVEGAMKALEALRNEGSLKAEVTRRGQPVTLSYEIR
ncbi:MAG: hypothetical protein H6732_17520 [Alphaproteobacteria bacterium]|nr:hypothetical protein [Alphaproteobacteria bacterium]